MATANRSRAAEGAALLDRKKPYWWEQVEESRLAEETVLQQIYGRPRSGSGMVSLLANYHRGDVIVGWSLAGRFGFATSSARFEPSLRAAWRQEIQKRKEKSSG